MSGATKEFVLQLHIDATAAKRGSAQFVGAVKSVQAAVRALEKDSTGAFTALRKGLQATPSKGMETALTGAATAAQKSEAAAKRLAVSVQNSMTTASGQAAKLRAQFQAMGDTAGIERTEAALAKLQASAKAAGSTTQLGAAKADFRATIAGLQGEAKAQEQAAQAAMKRVAATEALRKRHDEVFAVSQRYESSLEEISQLENAGAISAQKAAQARARAAQQLEAGAVATGKYGQALRVSRHNVTNFSNEIYDLHRRAGRFDMRQVAMQLSQVGQQGAVTGNYLQALAIQLPDLALGFGPVGIAAGAVAGVLATTLIGAMSATGDKADEMKNKVHALSTALDSLEDNSRASAAQIERHLKSAFGNVAADVQSLIEDLRQAEFAVISREMRQEIEGATTELTRLSGAFDVLWSDLANPGSVEAGYLARTRQIIADAGIAYGEFQRLESAVRAVFTAQDVNGFVASLSEARTLAQDIGGPVGDKIAAALLQAAKDAGILNRVMGEAASETGRSSESASGLSHNIGTAADEAARLLANLNSVPGAVAVMGKSVGEQIAALQAQNKSLGLQIESGLSSVAANRRVQLDDMVSAAAAKGQPLTVDQIAPHLDQIAKLEAAAKRQQELRDKLAEMNRPPRKASGGGRGAALSKEAKARDRLTESIEKQLLSLQQEAATQALLSEGRYESAEAARLAAEAMQANGGQIDAATDAMLRQIDAQAVLTEQARNGGIAASASKSLEDGLRRGLSQALQGETQNFGQQLANTVRASIADALADRIVDSLGIDQLFNVGSHAAALQMQSGIIAGGQVAAQAMATAVATGQATASTTGGGGGGFGSILGTIFGAFMGVPVAREGMVTGGGGVPAVATATAPAALFRGAPHYAEGTANTSGIPAILHPNEAVVPLSRGRKIPVDLSGVDAGNGRAVVFNGGINVHVESRRDGETDPEFAQRIAESMQDQLEALIESQIFEAQRYGGALNPRGGR